MSAASPRDALRLQLGAIRGCRPEPGALFEIRSRVPGVKGMRQDWLDVGDIDSAAAAVLHRGQVADAFIGCAPRRERHGGASAIDQVNVLWADCDTPASVRALEAFGPAPTFTVLSGSVTDGVPHVHAWWALKVPLSPELAERANRRVAHALGADAKATDAARILRPVGGTLNFKADPPRPVVAGHLGVDIYVARDVVGHLADPPVVPLRPRLPGTTLHGDDPLLTIPAAEYIEALTGRVVGADGKTACPFHNGGAERTPSLHAYSTDWACFGSCEPAPGAQHAGGSIIDFGSRLYAIEPRGRGFHDIRRRLARDLLASVEGTVAS